MVLMWYGGSKVVLWFFDGTVVSFSFSLACLASVFKYSLFFCLRQWVSVWEGRGSKNWLVLDLVYFLVVLLLRLI